MPRKKPNIGRITIAYKRKKSRNAQVQKTDEHQGCNDGSAASMESEPIPWVASDCGPNNFTQECAKLVKRQTYLMSVQCYAPGCTNTGAKLVLWEKEQCPHHHAIRTSISCDCSPPFQFFQFPTQSINPGMRQKWLDACHDPEQPNREPLRTHRICSKHFVGGKPGDDPPVLFLKQLENVSKVIEPPVNGAIAGFDPDRSQREMRKINTRISQKKKKTVLYDEAGVLVDSGMDWCDCLETKCPGCHRPCPKCRSPKCGMECRVNRSWYYQQVEIEGSNRTIQWQTCPSGI